MNIVYGLKKLIFHSQFKYRLKNFIQSAVYESQTYMKLGDKWRANTSNYNLGDNAL